MIAVGSLFSGIGGLELGLEAAFAEAGIAHRVAWQVEMDPFCRSILARHWTETDRSVVDVRAASSLPRVDLICGGFPCQDVSSAGLGAGLDGARSGLWFAMRDTIAALRPGIVVAENVASGKRRYLCRVLRDLRELGYHATAYQLGAHDVGAPHRRERVFVVALADSNRLGGVEPEGGERGERGRAQDGGSARTGGDVGHGPASVADPERVQLREQQGRGSGQGGPGPAEPGDAGARTMGDPHRSRLPLGGVERGDAGPQLATPERAGLLDHADMPGQQRPDARTERRGGGECGAAGDGRRVVAAQPGLGGGADGLPAGLDRALPDRWPAGRGEAQHPWEPPRTVQSRDPSRRARLRALGNAVCPQQARAIGRALIAVALPSLGVP